MGLSGFQIRPVPGSEIADLGVETAPNRFRTYQNGGALRAPPFWMGFEAVQGRLDPPQSANSGPETGRI